MIVSGAADRRTEARPRPPDPPLQWGVEALESVHARSTTLAPSRPCGRKTSTRISSDERPDVLPGAAAELAGDVLDRHGLDHAEDQPADDGAVDVADAAEDRGGERLQTGEEAHPEVDVGVAQPVRDARDGGEGGAEGERDHDDAVDVDAHQPRGVGVLRRGLHRPARSGCG